MTHRILIACESSGTVREAFRARGFDAWSCDLLPADDGSEFHIQGDALDALDNQWWDLVIAHPPCTYLSASGLHWNKRRPARALQTEDAVRFFMEFAGLAVPTAIENPVGLMSTRWRKPDQIIQPYQFGDDASKATCLWLTNGLPKLQHTGYVEPRMVNGKPRWSNQTDSGQNRLPPSKDRWKERSKTYSGIAQAMAEQWGDWLRQNSVHKVALG